MPRRERPEVRKQIAARKAAAELPTVIAAEPQKEEVTVTTPVAVHENVSDDVRAAIEEEMAKIEGEGGVAILTESAPEAPATEPKPATATAKVKAEKAEKIPAAPKVLARDLPGHCAICGRSLFNEKSVIRGIGPVCYHAMQRQYHWTDEEAKQVVATVSDEEWNKLIVEVRKLLLSYEGTINYIPEGYVEMSKWWGEAQRRGLKNSAISRAVGGDRAIKPVLGEEFVTVYVQLPDSSRTRKYLPPEAWTDAAFDKIRNSESPRPLVGAAKAAKEAAEAKAEAAKHPTDAEVQAAEEADDEMVEPSDDELADSEDASEEGEEESEE